MLSTYKNHLNTFLGALILLVVGIILGVIFSPNTVSQSAKNNQVDIAEAEIQKEVLANKAKCQKDAQVFYKEKQSKESFGAHGYGVLGVESYAFNSELNTCLLAWEDMSLLGNGTSVHVRYITDIYSNNNVYSWWERSNIKTGQTETVKGSEAEFNTMLQHYGLY